jgi:hypothetical protein
MTTIISALVDEGLTPIIQVPDVLQSIDNINRQSAQSFLIHDAFKYCGLNPWSMENSMKAFKEHLDQLESNHILKAMITNQTALQLH